MFASFALLAGCASETSEDSDVSTYCDLIDIDSVAPVVGESEVKDFGELRSADDVREQRARTSASMARYADEDPDHYVALETDDYDLGFAAWVDEETASAGLVKVAQEFDTNLDQYDSEKPATQPTRGVTRSR